MQHSVSEDCVSLNELSIYIQPLQIFPQLYTHTYTNIDSYLIKLWVESLLYDCCFVLGFLVNIWFEIPEKGI